MNVGAIGRSFLQSSDIKNWRFSPKEKRKKKQKVEFTLEKPNIPKTKAFGGKEKKNTIKIAYPSKFKYN
jgi:hypothetical protein